MATQAQLRTAIADNADWFSTQSVTKAKLLEAALNEIILTTPRSARKSGQGANMAQEWDIDTMKKQLDDVRSWLDSNDTSRTSVGSGVINPDFSTFDNRGL